MRELWLENSQRAPAAAEELRLLVDWQNQQPRGLADGGGLSLRRQCGQQSALGGRLAALISFAGKPVAGDLAVSNL